MFHGSHMKSEEVLLRATLPLFPSIFFFFFFFWWTVRLTVQCNYFCNFSLEFFFLNVGWLPILSLSHIEKKKCNNKKYSLLEWHCKMRYWEGHKHFKIEQLYRTAKLLVQLEFIRIHFFRKCMETSLNFLSSFTLYDIFIYGRAYFSFFNICRFPFSTIFARLELCVCHYFFFFFLE